MTSWVIYLLRDPRGLPLGYVGQTRRRLETRVRQHLTAAKAKPGRPACAWLLDLVSRDLVPTVQVLERCTSAEGADAAERRWIRACRKGLRLDLLNSTAGGQARYGPKHAAAVRAALARPETRARKAAAGRAVATRSWQDPAIRARHVEGQRADWQRPERQTAARAAWEDPDRRAARGRAISESFKRPEVHERIVAANQARARRPERRAALSSEMTARWRQPEYRARVGAAVSAALSDPVRGAENTARLRAMNADPARRAEHAARSRALWADPVWREQMLAARAAARARRAGGSPA